MRSVYLLLGVFFFSVAAQADDRVADALSLLLSGQPQEASKKIDAVLADDPKSVEAQELKGRILIALGKYQEGADLLFKILEKNPKRTDLYQYIGDAAFRERAWPDALEAYSRFMKDTKEGRDAYLKVLYCKVAMQDLSEVGRLVSSFDPLDPMHPGYYFGRAALAAALKKPKEEDEFLKKAKTLYGLSTFNRYQVDYLFLIKSISTPETMTPEEKKLLEPDKAAAPTKKSQ